MTATFDETKHPRHPKGSERGGEFAPKYEALPQMGPEVDHPLPSVSHPGLPPRFPPGEWDPHGKVKFWPQEMGQYSGFRQDAPYGPFWKAIVGDNGEELAFWFTNVNGYPHHDDMIAALMRSETWPGATSTTDIAGYGFEVDRGVGEGRFSNQLYEEIPQRHRRDIKDANEMLEARIGEPSGMRASALNFEADVLVAAEQKLARQYEKVIRRAAKRAASDYLEATRVIQAAGQPEPEEVVRAAALLESFSRLTGVARRALLKDIALVLQLLFGDVEEGQDPIALYLDILQQQIGVQAARLVNGAQDAAADVLLDAMAEGWSVPQTAKALEAKLVSVAPWQARMLARTDLVALANGASLRRATVMEDPGVAYKTWLATPDERTRIDHRHAHGQTVPKGQPFMVGGEQLLYPGDPSASDGNVINCRCTVIYGPSPLGPEGIRQIAMLPDLAVSAAGWDETKHPRHPKGSERGGQFALYHGTNVPLQPGDVVTTARELGYQRPGELPAYYDPAVVYMSTGDHLAERYAVAKAGKEGGEPHVYEVEPVGEVLTDPEAESGFGTDQRIAPAARVVREVELPGLVHWDDGMMKRGPGSAKKLYHVAPPSQRENIASEGLQDKLTGKGVFLWETPEDAEIYQKIVGGDVYEVDPEGLEVAQDPWWDDDPERRARWGGPGRSVVTPGVPKRNVRMADLTAAAWDESKHPREPSGTERGGQFRGAALLREIDRQRAERAKAAARGEPEHDPAAGGVWYFGQELVFESDKPGMIETRPRRVPGVMWKAIKKSDGDWLFWTTNTWGAPHHQQVIRKLGLPHMEGALYSGAGMMSARDENNEALNPELQALLNRHSRVLRDAEELAAAAGPDVKQLGMVAVYPTSKQQAALAVEGGQEQEKLHVTLVFLGDQADYDADLVREALAEVASRGTPLEGKVGGIGAFAKGEDGAPVIALPSVKGLAELRDEVVTALADRGIESPSEHGWTPHITLMYTDDPSELPPVPEVPLTFEAVAFVEGDELELFPLGGELVAAGWDESQHPRHPAGTKEGGEFAPRGFYHGARIVVEDGVKQGYQAFRMERTKSKSTEGRTDAGPLRETYQEAYADALAAADAERAVPRTEPALDERMANLAFNAFQEDMKQWYTEKEGFSSKYLPQQVEWLEGRYEESLARSLPQLRTALANAGVEGVVIRPQIDYSRGGMGGDLDVLLDPDATHTMDYLIDMPAAEGGEVPGFTVWTNEDGTVEIEDVLDITDTDFFPDGPDSETAVNYSKLVEAARGGPETEGFVTLYRGMTDAEFDEWDAGNEIQLGKFFAGIPTTQYAQDVSGQPPNLYTFKVPRHMVMQVGPHEYQLKKRGKLDRGTIVQASAWDEAAHPRWPAGDERGGEFRPKEFIASESRPGLQPDGTYRISGAGELPRAALWAKMERWEHEWPGLAEIRTSWPYLTAEQVEFLHRVLSHEYEKGYLAKGEAGATAELRQQARYVMRDVAPPGTEPPASKKPAPAASPGTRSVMDTLTVGGGRNSENMRTAVRIVDDTLRFPAVPGEPRINMRGVGGGMSRNAAFYRTTQLQPAQITVSARTGNPISSVTHELGHYLDSLVGQDEWAATQKKVGPRYRWNDYSSKQAAGTLRPVVEAVKDTEMYRQLDGASRGGPRRIFQYGGRSFQPGTSHIRYLMRPEELVARSFEQYIAAKNPYSKLSLTRRHAGNIGAQGMNFEPEFPGYMTGPDLHRVNAVWETVLKNRGLLKKEGFDQEEARRRALEPVAADRNP